MTRQITAIYGVEPGREAEYPIAHAVGSESHIAGRGKVKVEWIERRHENYGDHGLDWFDVLSAGIVVASVQARAVAEIHYGPEVPA
jgi:hypothetical protein